MSQPTISRAEGKAAEAIPAGLAAKVRTLPAGRLALPTAEDA